MSRSIPRNMAVLLVTVLVIAVGGAFFALSRDKKEKLPPAAEVKSYQIGVINMERAIAAHPKYPVWLAARQEEKSLMADFENSGKLLASEENDRNLAMQKSMGEVFEQEFNAKMKAKQDELNAKMSEKMQIMSQPLNDELYSYIQQVEEEYQPQLFDLNLKLRVLQMEEPQAKDIISKIEALKKEQNAKIELKNKELSQKMDEMMAPEIKKFDEEMNRYAAELTAELNAKMSVGAQRSHLADMPPELKELEEKIAAKKQQSSVIYDGIAQEVRYRAIDIAVREGLEAVIGDFIVNFDALDITDLVIAEFKK